ncbi:MAG: murein biosynthesis integral membrane protein MurJ [Defluviitaleaceae bacterium]|nr:murein biosynthesis integral membrane protein MurJ [Defluviitaleaceae bacterium]
MKNNFAKSSIILGIALVLAKMTGFVREIILAAFFGADVVSDAFVLANTIFDTFIAVLGASFAACFIPVYQRAKGDKILLTRSVMSVAIIMGLAITLVLAIFPNVVLRLIAFQIDPETFEIAVFFVRYMAWSVVFIILTDIFNAHLEIESAFFSSGMRYVWRNLTVALGLVLGAMFGFNLVIALAPVVGNIFSMVIISLVSRKHGYVYRPYFAKSLELKEMLVLGIPIYITAIIGYMNLIISRSFATTLPVGNISFLNYSYRIVMLFTMLLGKTLFTVLYPHMSKLAADGDLVKLKTTLTKSVVYVMLVMIPFCVGLIILAQPGVRILFERGYFTTEHTFYTAAALRMYAFVLISGSLTPLMLRAFYVLQDAKTTIVVASISVIAGIGFNFLFLSIGVEGLALSASLSGFLAVVLWLILLRRRLGCLNFISYVPDLIKIVAATIVMGVFVWFAAGMLPLMTVTIWQSALMCVILTMLAMLIYCALLASLKCKIFLEIISQVRKFKKG